MSLKTGADNPLSRLESLFEEYLVTKAPYSIPESGRDGIVKFMPWIVLIAAIVYAQLALGPLGLNIFLPYVLGTRGISGLIAAILHGIAAVMLALSVKGLFAQSQEAWRKVFYAELIILVAGLFESTVVFVFVSCLITFYILFQIKRAYK
ncbi:MAG: hypothetical protein N2691_05235 [Patescibacteria group bacterium]|nr:hypothetical protein [Patescibacteria group bacterium]